MPLLTEADRQNIGDVLVGAGFLRPEQLSHGVRLQKKLLACALIAVLSLGPLSAAKSAESSSGTSRISGKDIMTTMSAGNTLSALEILFQHSEIVVTYGDILKGTLTSRLPPASKYRTRTCRVYGYLPWTCIAFSKSDCKGVRTGRDCRHLRRLCYTALSRKRPASARTELSSRAL